MKKCPTCEKTFDDSMRFCQVDGTPLVDDAPAFDPYATIVAPAAPAEDTAAAEPADEVAAPEPEVAPAEAAPDVHQTVGSLPIAPPEDVLDLPSTDPLKTMYVSESELQEAMGSTETADEPDIVELPPIEEIPAPEPPSFIAPEVPAPSFGDAAPAPPPSPFSEPEPFVEEPAAPPTVFDEPETMIQPAAFDPPPPAPVAEWTPPPAPDASWQNQEIGSNTPFQPPPAGVEGENKTLAIVSLVCGILSILCCGWFIPGIAAIVMGFIARGKANSDPANYGGAGLALGGMITGAISIVLGIIVVILYLAGAIAGNLGNF